MTDFIELEGVLGSSRGWFSPSTYEKQLFDVDKLSEEAIDRLRVSSLKRLHFCLLLSDKAFFFFLLSGQHEPPQPRQHAGLLPESLIWAYIVQLSSALRTIHTAGLACRVMDPSKILITGKTRYRRGMLQCWV